QFSTDVQYPEFFGFTVMRSADGKTVSQSGEAGIATIRPVAIFTNATQFDEKGSLRLDLGDEVSVHDPNDPQHTDIGFASGDTTLNNAFEPAAATAIPLPSAALGSIIAIPLVMRAMRRISPAQRCRRCSAARRRANLRSALHLIQASLPGFRWPPCRERPVLRARMLCRSFRHWRDFREDPKAPSAPPSAAHRRRKSIRR